MEHGCGFRQLFRGCPGGCGIRLGSLTDRVGEGFVLLRSHGPEKVLLGLGGLSGRTLRQRLGDGGVSRGLWLGEPDLRPVRGLVQCPQDSVMDAVEDCFFV